MMSELSLGLLVFFEMLCLILFMNLMPTNVPLNIIIFENAISSMLW